MRHTLHTGLRNGLYGGLLWLRTMALAQPQTIDLEQAREVDLDGLRGLGPSTTRQILQEREKQAFRDWKDLMKRTPGMGPKKASQLSEQGLRVQGQTYPPSRAH